MTDGQLYATAAPAAAPRAALSEAAHGFILARQARAGAVDDRAWAIASDIEDEQMLRLATASGDARAVSVRLAAMITAMLRAFSLGGTPANAFEILALAASALADSVLLDGLATGPSPGREPLAPSAGSAATSAP